MSTVTERAVRLKRTRAKHQDSIRAAMDATPCKDIWTALDYDNAMLYVAFFAKPDDSPERTAELVGSTPQVAAYAMVNRKVTEAINEQVDGAYAEMQAGASPGMKEVAVATPRADTLLGWSTANGFDGDLVFCDVDAWGLYWHGMTTEGVIDYCGGATILDPDGNPFDSQKDLLDDPDRIDLLVDRVVKAAQAYIGEGVEAMLDLPFVDGWIEKYAA